MDEGKGFDATGVDVSQLKMLGFNDQRKLIALWLRGPNGGQLWDLMCGLRGPDSPSEKPNMDPTTSQRMYRGRRDRKFKTVEVIRSNAFFGTIGGAARSHPGDSVTLPPPNEWDHFDKHVQRAASILGLTVVTEEPKREGVKVNIPQPTAPSPTPKGIGF